MVEFELPPFQQRMGVETRFANLSSGNYTAFNLQKGSSVTNVMMHIRVDPDQLVLNSMSNGAWGSEVRINKPGIGTPGKLVTIWSLLHHRQWWRSLWIQVQIALHWHQHGNCLQLAIKGYWDKVLLCALPTTVDSITWPFGHAGNYWLLLLFC